MGERTVSGLRRVAYSCDPHEHPVAIMARGYCQVMDEVEGSDEWLWLPEEMGALGSRVLHGVGTRIVRTESTLVPQFRFALVEVSGEWIDGDGNSVAIKGLP